MAFNISSFRSSGLTYDGARPTLFEVHVNFPTLASNGQAETNRLRFLAQATSLPASTVDKIPVAYFGRTINVDGARTFEDWQIEVLNDEDFSIKAAFEAWLNGINTHISNRKDPAFAGMAYKSTATVYQLSKELDGNDIENAIRAYTFSGMFPTQVSQIRLDWGDTGRIETFTVNLAYDYWVPGADENYTANDSKFNGVDGSAKSWSPRLASDNS